MRGWTVLLNDCKANLPNEDYQRIAAEFSFIWFWNPGQRTSGGTPPRSGETGAALLRIWRGNMVLVIVSLAVAARYWFGWGKHSYKIMHSYPDLRRTVETHLHAP